MSLIRQNACIKQSIMCQKFIKIYYAKIMKIKDFINLL